jgi:hypothetical protein
MTSKEYSQEQQRRRQKQAAAVGSGYSTRPSNQAGSGLAVLVVLLIVAAVIVGNYAWKKAEPPPANTRPKSQVASEGRPLKPLPPIPGDNAPELQHRRPSPYTDPSLARQTEPPATSDQTNADVKSPAGQVIEFHGVDHKGVNKGCDRQGELILDATSLRFKCPSKPTRSIIIDRSALRADDDGVVVAKSGDKYHFKIDGMNKDRVRAVFRDWAPRPASEPAGR